MGISYWDELTQHELDDLDAGKLREAIASLAEDEAKIQTQLDSRGKRIEAMGAAAVPEDTNWLHSARQALAMKRRRLKKFRYRLRVLEEGEPVREVAERPAYRTAREILADMCDELARWDVAQTSRLSALLYEAETIRSYKRESVKGGA